MRRLMLLLGCMGALLGCAGSEGPAGPAGKDGAPGPTGAKGEKGEAAASAVDGSRLTARTFTTKDGAKGTAGWFDEERGEPCAFHDVGGELLCVPHVALRTERFADAECTEALHITDPGDALVVDTHRGLVWRGGGEEVTASTQRYTSPLGVCKPDGGDAIGHWRLLDASSQFAAADVD